MPTYDYECKSCGHTFELFQRITAHHIKSCPKCKGKVKRLIGNGAGIIFKGSGFYHTDYKSKNNGSSCPIDKNKPACSGCNPEKK